MSVEPEGLAEIYGRKEITVVVRLTPAEWLTLRDIATGQGKRTGQMATDVVRKYLELVGSQNGRGDSGDS